jgi:hypothetical protein
MKRLVFVLGATSEIGLEYLNYFSKEDHVIAISRRGVLENKNITSLICDLTNRDLTKEVISNIDISKYSNISVLHFIGSDVFENKSYPKLTGITTINSLVYNTCVNSFKYPLEIIIDLIKKQRNIGKNINLSLLMLGAISDRYEIPFFISFRESKNIIRSYISNLSNGSTWIKGFVLNVSTVNTKLTRNYRPYADKAYWLVPKDVLNGSIDKILNQKNKFEEIDIYKFDPNFENDYYSNNDKIYKKWIKEMYNRDWKK